MNKILTENALLLVLMAAMLSIVVLFFLVFRFGPSEGPLAGVINLIMYVLGPIK